MEKESWQAYENIVMNIKTVKAVKTYLEGLLDERIPVFPPHYFITILPTLIVLSKLLFN